MCFIIYFIYFQGADVVAGAENSTAEPETTTELFADLSIAEANGAVATPMSKLYQKEICSVVEVRRSSVPFLWLNDYINGDFDI